MVPQRRAEPGHLGVLALVGLCVCIGESPVAPPRRMDGLATRLRGVSIPSGDLALGTGVGCREKEQEGRRQRQRREGGRLLPWKELQGILGSEFSLQRTGLRGVGGMVGEGDGEASVLLLSLARSHIPTDGVVPSRPRNWPPAAPSLSCLPARLVYRRQSGPFQEACLPARQQQISALKRHSAFIPANKLTAKGASDAFSPESAEMGFAVHLNRLPSTHHIKCI